MKEDFHVVGGLSAKDGVPPDNCVSKDGAWPIERDDSGKFKRGTGEQFAPPRQNAKKGERAIPGGGVKQVMCWYMREGVGSPTCYCVAAGSS